MPRRIVSIQHGDYRESSRIVKSGEVDPYFGMTYTHEVLETLFGDDAHLVICLNAPAYRERHGSGEYVGVPTPRLPRRVPARVAEYLLARRITGLIREFRPTHVLLRTGLPIVSLGVLKLCRRKRYDTLVVLANVVGNDNPKAVRHNRRLMGLMNQPFVSRVGNHKRPATQSLVDAGLDPLKAVAWDWPGQRQAEDYPSKQLPPPPFELVFAGSISAAKGVGDLIDAASILHRDGITFRLTIIGGGADLDAMRDRARALPEGVVRFEGRLGNDEVFHAMLGAALIFIPSRHEFPEGMPLTLTEALASRTPVVASDHPVIVRGFVDGEGLRFFEAANPASLAQVTQAILLDPAGYAKLSTTTLDAFNRVNCPTTFGDLIDRWVGPSVESSEDRRGSRVVSEGP